MMGADYLRAGCIDGLADAFAEAEPFSHVVIDDFFRRDVALELESEFPAPDDQCWHRYNNALEQKRSCNNWNAFPSLTYSTFNFLNSHEFVERLSAALNVADLFSDPGLNGGGWHAHGPGGKLNPHLDYSSHPKTGMRRRINLIVYLNSGWMPRWGGHLGLWTQEAGAVAPGNLVKTIDPVFNRAVIFDTTQDSWHGLSSPIECPAGEARRSLATYYLDQAKADPRSKSLFAPTPDQKEDPAIAELIRTRAHSARAHEVYLAR